MGHASRVDSLIGSLHLRFACWILSISPLVMRDHPGARLIYWIISISSIRKISLETISILILLSLLAVHEALLWSHQFVKRHSIQSGLCSVHLPFVDSYLFIYYGDIRHFISIAFFVHCASMHFCWGVQTSLLFFSFVHAPAARQHCLVESLRQHKIQWAVNTVKRTPVCLSWPLAMRSTRKTS